MKTYKKATLLLFTLLTITNCTTVKVERFNSDSVVHWDKKESVLKAVSLDGTKLKYVSRALQKDEEVVLTAVIDKRKNR
jgi:hypothetical protein